MLQHFETREHKSACMNRRAEAACLALIIEKAEPTLTGVELHLSTFISSRNNDPRERQLSEPERAGWDGGEVRRAHGKKLFCLACRFRTTTWPPKGPRRRVRDRSRWKRLGGPSLYVLETLELLRETRVLMGFRQIATLSALSLSTARQSR